MFPEVPPKRNGGHNMDKEREISSKFRRLPRRMAALDDINRQQITVLSLKAHLVVGSLNQPRSPCTKELLKTILHMRKKELG